MKKDIFLSVFALTAMLAATTSCKTDGGSDNAASDDANQGVMMIPVKTEGARLWSMAGPDGELIFEEEMPGQLDLGVNGYFNMIDIDGKVTVFRLEGKRPTEANEQTLSRLNAAGYMTCGVIPVVAGDCSRIEYYKGDGTPAFGLEPVDGVEIVSVSSMFSEDRAVFIADNGMAGVIDNTGKIIVKPDTYGSISDFRGGVAVAYEGEAPLGSCDEEFESEGHYVVIDSEGKKLFDLDNDYYPMTSTFRGGYLAVRNGDRCGLYSRTGEYRNLPSKVGYVLDVNDKYIAYESAAGGSGVIDQEFNNIVPPRYSTVSLLPDETFLAMVDGDHFVFLNSKGEQIERDKKREGFYYYGYLMNFADYCSSMANLPTKFQLLTTDDGRVNFYDFKGRLMTKKPTNYEEVGMYLYSPQVIATYYNAYDMGRELASRIKSDALNGVTLGAPADSIPDYGVYAYQGYNHVNVPFVVSRNRYNISDTYQLDGPIGWNGETPKVVMAVSQVSLPDVSAYTGAKQGAMKALEEKGYRVKQNCDAFTLMSLGHTRAVLMPFSDGMDYDSSYALAVVLFPETGQSDSTEATLLADALKTYEPIASRQGNPESRHEDMLMNDEDGAEERVTEIVIVEDDEIEDAVPVEILEETEEAFRKANFDSATDDASESRDEVGVDDNSIVSVAPDRIFTAVEEPPTFPGGESAMYEFMKKNLHYPEMAQQNNVQGRVIVQFVVEKDGSIGEVKVVRKVDPDLDGEAVRLVKSMPKFIPGKMNGEPVRVWFTLPVNFKLANA